MLLKLFVVVHQLPLQTGRYSPDLPDAQNLTMFFERKGVINIRKWERCCLLLLLLQIIIS